MASNQSLYDRDFYAWANEQAALLRARKLQDVDLDNVAEEIESMGRSERRELISRLTVLLVHLLKWSFQHQFRSKSWRLTIREQRTMVAEHLDENPSLKPHLPGCIVNAYRSALVETEVQTGIGEKYLPQELQWSIDQIMSHDWFPD